jgi:hypothetical protein
MDGALYGSVCHFQAMLEHDPEFRENCLLLNPGLATIPLENVAAFMAEHLEVRASRCLASFSCLPRFCADPAAGSVLNWPWCSLLLASLELLASLVAPGGISSSSSLVAQATLGYKTIKRWVKAPDAPLTADISKPAEDDDDG